MSTRGREGRTGFIGALRYAFEGLHYAVRTQRTFRIQLVCAAGVAVLTVWLRLSPVEAAVVALAMSAVLAAELFNTGVEAIADLLVERNHHRLAKIAKDIAAGGVVTSIVGAIIAGGLLLGPPLLARLGAGAPWAARLSAAGAVLVLTAAALAVLRMVRRPSADEPTRTRVSEER